MDQPNSGDAMMRPPQMGAVQMIMVAMALLTSQSSANFAQHNANQFEAEKALLTSPPWLPMTLKDFSQSKVNALIKEDPVTTSHVDYSFAKLINADNHRDNGVDNNRQPKNHTAGFMEAKQEHLLSVDYSKSGESNFEGVLERQLEYERLNSDEHDTASKDHLESKKLLSRRRRYLLFPEGSSFQIVYDGIIGVVDYTNYLILGITLALAWELPSKAPSEQLEDLKQRLEDGVLGTVRNDSIDKIKYVDSKIQQSPLVTKPNYIDLGIGKNINLKPRYPNGQLSKYVTSSKNSHRRIFTPVFIPPMHGKYYYPTNDFVLSHRPYDTYYKTKPLHYGQTYYSYPKTMALSAGRRKDHFYRSHSQSMSRENPFYKYTRQGGKKYNQMLPITPNVKYPWWSLSDRLSKLPPSHVHYGHQKTTNIAHYKNNKGYLNSLPAARGRSMNFWQGSDQEAFISTSDPGAQHIGENKGRQHTEETSTFSSIITKPIKLAKKKHRIYPILGKRSAPDRKRRRIGTISDNLSKYERTHIRYHRETRHTLYEKIEKYLDKRGSNGHHCVLRAICETRRKASEKEPGTFVGELMRAVFTIPEAIQEDVVSHKLKYKEQRYDSAQELLGDCEQRYFHCKESLWKADFVS